MNVQMIIVLCVLAFMVVMLLTNAIPYGITAMTCCCILVFTKVLTLSEAFSGLSNSTTLLVAPMIVVASALGRTSLVRRLRGVMARLRGKSTLVLIAGLLVITIVLSQLMGQIACLTVILTFLQTVESDDKVSPGRLFFLAAVVNTIFTSKIPFGMGATLPGTINSYYQGLVTEDQLLGIGDVFKAMLLPMIAAFIYCLLFYRLIPQSDVDSSQIAAPKENKEMSPRNEKLVLGGFIVIMIGFMFSNQIGKDISNCIPAAVLIFLIWTKAIPRDDAMRSLTSDLVWMIAGMGVISSALSKTGVGELIGNTVLKILGGHPSALLVTIVFCVTAVIMTNFMSNLGTMAILAPIAASTALAGGMNVQAVVLTCTMSAWFAFMLPTGCSGSIMAYGMCGQSPAKLFKFTVPLLLLEMVTLIAGIQIFFPIYG